MATNKLPTITSPPWSPTTKRIVALVVLGLALFIAREIGPTAWASIVLAVVFAYLLSPLVRVIERRLAFIGSSDARRTLSVVIAWLVVFGILGLIVGLIVPATIAQIRQFAEDLPRQVQSAEEDVREWLNQPIHLGDYTIVPWEELQSFVMSPSEEGETTDASAFAETLRNTLLSLADSGLGVLGSAVSIVLSSFLVLVMIFYLMRDGPTFAATFVKTVPENYRGDAERLLYELGAIWNAYLRGQLALGTSVGVATYVAALILGLPQPLVLGLLAGFLEFVPNIGPTLSSIPAIMFALTTPSATISGLDAGLLYAFVVTMAYVAIQQLEAVFLVPRILGSSLDLHPFVVLVAIVIGASLAGVLGVILAAPTVATVRLFLRYLRGKLLEEEAFPVVPAQSTRRSGFVYGLIRYFLSKRFTTTPPNVVETVRSRRAEAAESDASRRPI